jgi:two-component system LytT family response regulator
LSLQYASSLLSTCSTALLAGTANTQDKAVTLINELNPDLILLDVELHGGDGFEVLKRTADKGYQVIFTTALYDEALNIINLSGVPVLQKPLDCDELSDLINNFKNEAYVKAQKICLQVLRQTMTNNNIPKSIALTLDGKLQHIPLEQIIKISFKENSLLFFMQGGSILSPGKDIKFYEKQLILFGFFRVSATEILNLFHVDKKSSYHDFVTLSDGSSIILSAKKNLAFFETLKNFKPTAGSSEA